jgi:hypothetical protein
MTERSSDDSYWFAVKRYGFGWGWPASWQGWVTVLVYVVMLGGGLILAEPGPTRLIYSVALTIALIAIVVWKGERPAKWRWRRRQMP